MLVKAATLYYLEGKSQAEVAQEIGVSRSNVSRVLADARKNGIVEIRINDPFGRAQDLEAQLVARYGLRECRVAPSTGSDNQLSRVGALGAQWLIDNLPRDGVVEVPCLVDSKGIQPTHFGTLPTHLANLDAQHMAFHDLVATAVLEQDREAAVHALMVDPLTAAVCSLAETREMFDEMATVQSAYLPAFLNR